MVASQHVVDTETNAVQVHDFMKTLMRGRKRVKASTPATTMAHV